MSLIDLFLKRRSQLGRTGYRPRVELLEERQCLSVAAPTGVTLTALTPTQIKVTWNVAAGVSAYRVFHWEATKAVLVSTVAGNVSNATVGLLQPNQVHWFQVEALDASSSARSAWLSIKTPAEAITAPSNVRVVEPAQTQLKLTWTNATGALGYRIFVWDGTRSQQIGTTTPANPAFVVKNLTPGTTYYFYVQAFNKTNSASSAWVSGTTLAYGITAPTNVKTTVLGPSTIALSWKDVAAETGYRIFRWNGVSNVDPVVVATLAANTTGYQSIGLLPGRTYWFYVQAFNATKFANSGWVTGVTPAALPLQPPTQVGVTVTGTNSVAVSWSEPARAKGYSVYVWLGSYWVKAATVSAGTHSAPITGLATGRTYWFIVQAFTDNLAEVANSTSVFVNL